MKQKHYRIKESVIKQLIESATTTIYKLITKTYKIMTFTYLINVLLQWFFVRLTKHMKIDENGEYTIIDRWSLQYWVIPLTGWHSNFKYLKTGCNFMYITTKNNNLINN